MFKKQIDEDENMKCKYETKKKKKMYQIRLIGLQIGLS